MIGEGEGRKRVLGRRGKEESDREEGVDGERREGGMDEDEAERGRE